MTIETRERNELFDTLLEGLTLDKANVPFYLVRLQKGLDNAPESFDLGWARSMFQAAVSCLMGHDLVLKGGDYSFTRQIIPARDADLAMVRNVIDIEMCSGFDRCPYSEALIRMRAYLQVTYKAWISNSWEAHSVAPVGQIAALVAICTADNT